MSLDWDCLKAAVLAALIVGLAYAAWHFVF
jgi:hypothetical protein